MKDLNLYLETVDELRSIEKVHPSVSKKYVPIYTSDIVEILHPEFRYVHGVQFVKGLTRHYVDLMNKEGDTIRIYNSYDRTLALRVNYITADAGVSIDLGIDRLVHIGSKAKDFTDDLSDAKEAIINGVKNAKFIMHKLTNTLVTENMAKEISDIIFVKELNKNVQEYTNYVDILLEKNIDLKKYIDMSIHNYIEGEYTFVKDGVKHNGRKIRSVLRKVRLENKIMKYIKENFPEYFL